MKLERWHRQLKYDDAGGTVLKCIDKPVAIVSKAVAKKLLMSDFYGKGKIN